MCWYRPSEFGLSNYPLNHSASSTVHPHFRGPIRTCIERRRSSVRRVTIDSHYIASPAGRRVIVCLAAARALARSRGM